MSRRQIILAILLGLILLVIPTAAGLAFSEAGRQQNEQESRAACRRAIPRNVAAINSVRAQARNDETASADKAVPMAVRLGRRAEIAKDVRYAIVLDSQTDQSAWRSLDYKVDQDAVMHGVNGHPPFLCDHAFPPARFLP